MQVRRASADDAERCAEIYAPFVTDSWVSFEEQAPDTGEVAGRITTFGETHGWWIAEMSGTVAGYAYGSAHRSRTAYKASCEVAVYVDPAFSRQGVGSALYGRLLPALGKRGFHAAFAGIALPNEASIALHEMFSFTPVGVYREVGWKLGSWRDVGWWQLLL